FRYKKGVLNTISKIRRIRCSETEIPKVGFRLHALIPLIPRVSREDTEIEGYIIPIGAKVLVNAWAMGRDPDIWADPRFENDPKDFTGNEFEYISFVVEEECA
ncbi:hypothetical protein MIMGU_mgv11b021166mg, partial [Erythranthe guttata]